MSHAIVLSLKAKLLKAMIPFLFAAALFYPGMTICSESVFTDEVSAVISGPPPTVLQVGDNQAHTIGIGKKAGKAVFGDGRNADYTNVYSFDLLRGKGASVTGYTQLTFEDTSRICIKWESELTGRDGIGNPVMQGSGKIIQGTGSFRGIRGTASFHSSILPAGKEYPEGARKVKALIVYTLPNSKKRMLDTDLKNRCEIKTQNAAELIKTLGPEKAFKQIVNPDGSFIDDNSHVFCINSETGVLIAHKRNRVVGYNMNNYKDANNNFPYSDILEKAKTKDSGWISFLTYGSGSDRRDSPGLKNMYFLKVPGKNIVLCCGYFKD